MNKKILVVLLVILALILLVVFFVFGGFSEVKAPVDNPVTEIKNPVQNIEEPKIELGTPEIKTEDLKPSNEIYICVDKCGDGTCQLAGTVCKDKLNCICAETKEDCPQDCK